MSNHTPGPWAADDGETEGFFTRVLGPGNVLVAHCYPDIGDDVELPPSRAAVANARLIAATPELLETLRAIMAQIREDSDSADPMEPFSYDARWEQLATAADAAIAKAKGE